MKKIFSDMFMVYGLWLMVVFLVLLPFTIFHLPSTAHAVASIGIKQPDENAGVQVDNNSADTLMGAIIRNAIVLVFTIASVSTVVMFLWGSVDWILSGGDKEKIASARKKIMASLVGLILLAMSFLIISLIGVFIGFNPFKNLKIPGLGDGIGAARSGIITNPSDPNYQCGNFGYWDAKAKKCVAF